MNAGLISPPEITPREFCYGDYDIEGWPCGGHYDVHVFGSKEGEWRKIGKVEEPTEIRPCAIAWIESAPEKQFYVGATVRNGRSDNIYFVKAIKVSGRLVLWYHSKPTIKNADPMKWEIVEV